MKRALRALAGAFATFSVLPLGRLAPAEPPDAYALAFLPLVGAVVGALAGLAGYAISAWLHAGWSFVVAWAAWIALTGAIHLDGFMDACDGLFATVPAARRLEIMRDPHHGTYAIAGMLILAAFTLAALASIAPPWYPVALAFAAVTARVGALANAWFFAYDASGSMPAAFVQRPGAALLAVWFALAELLAWLVGTRALIVAPIAIALSLAGGFWASRRLDGRITGDVYGALVSVGETAALLLLVSLVR